MSKAKEEKKSNGVCPDCGSTFMVYQSGCNMCMQCGYSACDL